MKIQYLLLATVLILSSSILQANTVVTITSVSGDVQFRKGLDENWETAKVGMILEDIDTILTGNEGTVSLILESGTVFKMGSDALLDIGDLRTIMEQELFLYLMSEKIDKLEPVQKKAKLKIGNVSVVHGASAKTDSVQDQNERILIVIKEKNGAVALYDNKFYPNAIIKMHKIVNTNSEANDCGELYYLMGKSFEAINKSGQAIDHYNLALEQIKLTNCSESASAWQPDARDALERLKQK